MMPTQFAFDFTVAPTDDPEVLRLNPTRRPNAEIITRAVPGGFAVAFYVTLSTSGTNSLWEEFTTRAAAILGGCRAIAEYLEHQTSSETSKREVGQVLDWVRGIYKQNALAAA